MDGGEGVPFGTTTSSAAPSGAQVRRTDGRITHFGRQARRRLFTRLRVSAGFLIVKERVYLPRAPNAPGGDFRPYVRTFWICRVWSYWIACICGEAWGAGGSQFQPKLRVEALLRRGETPLGVPPFARQSGANPRAKGAPRSSRNERAKGGKPFFQGIPVSPRSRAPGTVPPPRICPSGSVPWHPRPPPFCGRGVAKAFKR